MRHKYINCTDAQMQNQGIYFRSQSYLKISLTLSLSPLLFSGSPVSFMFLFFQSIRKSNSVKDGKEIN